MELEEHEVEEFVRLMTEWKRTRKLKRSLRMSLKSRRCRNCRKKADGPERLSLPSWLSAAMSA